MRAVRKLVSRICSWGRWLLMALLVCAAVGVMFRQVLLAQLDERIRDHVESMIASHYVGFDVHLQAARRIEGRGIELRGLVLELPGGPTSDRRMLTIDEIFLGCGASLTDLVGGQPCVKQLVVRRAHVRVRRRTDGAWNIAQLLPLPEFGDSSPEVLVEDSLIELFDDQRPTEVPWALRDINVRMQRKDVPTEGERLVLSGTMRGDHFKRVQVAGTLDASTGDWIARGTLNDLDMSPRLLGSIPEDLAQYAAILAGVQARAHIEFQVSHRAGDAAPIRWLLTGRLTEGRLADSRLPYPLSDLEASIYCDNQELRITDVSARSGSGSLGLTCIARNFLTEQPFLDVTVDARNLALDQRLHDVLPDELRVAWRKFKPEGAIDARFHMVGTPDQLKTSLTTTCHDVSFAYERFPYRLQQGRGVIEWDGRKVTIREFTALAADQTVHIDLELTDPGPRAVGWVTLSVDGPVPLDNTLIAALPPAGQPILRSLHATGSIRLVSGRFEKTEPDAEPHARWELAVSDAAVQFERFPYPIHQINGRLVLVNHDWQVQRLQGYHGSNYLVCHGRWDAQPGPVPGGQLLLTFQCRDVPLDDALRDAVGVANPGAQRFWSSLRPRGSVDQLDVTMQWDTTNRKVQLDLLAEKWAATQNIEGRSIDVHPEWLPLLLHEVTGSVRFKDGHFRMESMAARRDDANVQWAGEGVVKSDQSWHVDLTQLIADRLMADHGFTEALPEALRTGLERMKYHGPLSFNGAVWLQGALDQPLTAGWDMLLDIEDGFVDNVLKLEHIRGSVRLTGQKTATTFGCRGEIAIDSLVSRGLQITQIAGPLWIDPRQIVLGSRAEATGTGTTPRRITGRAFGGSAALDASLKLDDRLPFALDLWVADADAAHIVRALKMGRHVVSGKVHASVHLSGAQAGLHTLRGNGRMRLSEADVYQLPVMVSLLNVLSLRRPDTNAFTQCDVDFRVNGEQAYLDRIDFNGDAISLKGKGWMDLNRRVNLDFYALVGRHEWQIPVIRELLAEASRNILLIQVDGTIDQPNVIRKPLPELDQTLQRIFPEAARTASPRFQW